MHLPPFRCVIMLLSFAWLCCDFLASASLPRRNLHPGCHPLPLAPFEIRPAFRCADKLFFSSSESRGHGPHSCCFSHTPFRCSYRFFSLRRSSPSVGVARINVSDRCPCAGLAHSRSLTTLANVSPCSKPRSAPCT